MYDNKYPFIYFSKRYVYKLRIIRYVGICFKNISLIKYFLLRVTNLHAYICARVSPKAFDKILTFICSKLFTSINFTTMTRKFRESRAEQSSSSSGNTNSSFKALYFTYNPDYTRSPFFQTE